MIYIDKSRVTENAEFTLEQLDFSENRLYRLKLIDEEPWNKVKTLTLSYG